MKQTKNSKIFKERLAYFVELEKTWEYTPRTDEKTGKPIPIGYKASPTKYDMQFKPVTSVKPLPFGELSTRLKQYEYYGRILKGGIKTSGNMRKQLHCLDWLPASEYSIDRLLFDCAGALWFENNRIQTEKTLNLYRMLKNRAALDRTQDEAIDRAADMRRLAVAVSPGLATGAAMLQLLDSPREATIMARNSAEMRQFGCILLSSNIQPRQQYPTEALLAFGLKWIFQHWPISPETERPKRGGPKLSLGPPCYDLIADFVNAILTDPTPEDTPENDIEDYDLPSGNKFDEITVKDNLLKRIHPKAQYCGW